MARRSDDGPWFVVQVAKGTPEDKPIHVGDVAQLSDELWPPEAQGFIVGTVTRVEDDPKNPLQFVRAVVEPTVPLDKLRRVTVLVAVE